MQQRQPQIQDILPAQTQGTQDRDRDSTAMETETDSEHLSKGGSSTSPKKFSKPNVIIECLG